MATPARFRQSHIADREFVRRDDARVAVAGRDKDESGAAADNSDLEGDAARATRQSSRGT
jgi:hypothetical protein